MDESVDAYVPNKAIPQPVLMDVYGGRQRLDLTWTWKTCYALLRSAENHGNNVISECLRHTCRDDVITPLRDPHIFN